MDVRDILKLALAAVNDAAVPEDLRAIAFTKAVDLIAASEGLAASMGAVQSGPAGGTGVAVAARGVTAGGLLEKIAAKLGLDVSVVGDVFAPDGNGSVDIIVPTGQLEPGKAPGMKQLALLTAAARQAGELDDFTGMDHIREFARQYNRYDSANFATDLQSMADEFRYRRDGRKVSVKLSRTGWERASELVARFGGGAQP